MCHSHNMSPARLACMHQGDPVEARIASNKQGIRQSMCPRLVCMQAPEGGWTQITGTYSAYAITSIESFGVSSGAIVLLNSEAHCCTCRQQLLSIARPSACLSHALLQHGVCTLHRRAVTPHPASEIRLIGRQAVAPIAAGPVGVTVCTSPYSQ